jgi:hypothetical protein
MRCGFKLWHPVQTRLLIATSSPFWCGLRCGMCDSGYYRLFGNCKICDGVALVTVLAIVVPAVVVLGTTVFIFWAGTHVPCTFRPTHPSHAARCSVAATSGIRYLSVIPLCDMVRVSQGSVPRPSLDGGLARFIPMLALLSRMLTGSKLSSYSVYADTDAWDLGRCGSSLPRDDSLCNHRGSAF